MSFRVKLIFSSINYTIPIEFKKILFPVNPNIHQTVKDLKTYLKNFVFGIFPNLSRFSLDLSIENYLLPEGFETSMILRENDEVE